MNYFPNGKEEISLVKFLAKYQYLKISDVKYFFKSKKYYQTRINNLVSKKLIRKIKTKLVLGEIGIEYVKLFGYDYARLNRNKKYNSRLLNISHIGAIYNNCDTINFTPSFDIKDKEIFTTTARKFIGILEINRIDYLAYYISKEHDKRYISSVIYDIQKEKKYKNIIIIVDNKDRIDINEFAFGMNQILIVENTIENEEKLKYLQSVNWSKIIKNIYNSKMVLNEYNFCDYTDYKNKYIATFYFLDTEKIARIKYFLRENNNKNIDIVCDYELSQQLKKVIPKANYLIVNLEKYIETRNMYD